MVNLSGRSRNLFETLAGTDPPFYAIFFVIAGADLDLTLVPAMGVVGLVYVIGRATGKFVGAAVGARRLKLEPAVQHFLGFGLLAQAGLAVGLTIAINQRFDTFAPIVSTVVLASVAIFEMVAPIRSEAFSWSSNCPVQAVSLKFRSKTNSFPLVLIPISKPAIPRYPSSRARSAMDRAI